MFMKQRDVPGKQLSAGADHVPAQRRITFQESKQAINNCKHKQTSVEAL